jgi:hypothetical protein
MPNTAPDISGFTAPGQGVELAQPGLPEAPAFVTHAPSRNDDALAGTRRYPLAIRAGIILLGSAGLWLAIAWALD